MTPQEHSLDTLVAGAGYGEEFGTPLPGDALENQGDEVSENQADEQAKDDSGNGDHASNDNSGGGNEGGGGGDSVGDAAGGGDDEDDGGGKLPASSNGGGGGDDGDDSDDDDEEEGDDADGDSDGLSDKIPETDDEESEKSPQKKALKKNGKDKKKAGANKKATAKASANNQGQNRPTKTAGSEPLNEEDAAKEMARLAEILKNATAKASANNQGRNRPAKTAGSEPLNEEDADKEAARVAGILNARNIVLPNEDSETKPKEEIPDAAADDVLRIAQEQSAQVQKKRGTQFDNKNSKKKARHPVNPEAASDPESANVAVAVKRECFFATFLVSFSQSFFTHMAYLVIFNVFVMSQYRPMTMFL
mgnify:CR=1 FL=1